MTEPPSPRSGFQTLHSPGQRRKVYECGEEEADKGEGQLQVHAMEGGPETEAEQEARAGPAEQEARAGPSEQGV